MRENLLACRSQRPEPPASAEEREPEPFAAERHGDVAAIEEAKLEQPVRSPAMDRERAGVETPDDPTSDTKIDQEADPHPNPNLAHPERPGR